MALLRKPRRRARCLLGIVIVCFIIYNFSFHAEKLQEVNVSSSVHSSGAGTQGTGKHAESTGTRDTGEHAEGTGTRDTAELVDSTPQREENNRVGAPTEYVFREYNNSNGVYTIRDLCIELNPRHTKNVLVVYNSDHTSKHQERLKDHHTPISGYPGWPVFYRQGPIPSKHVIMDHPAYFMVTTCEGNLHHYTEDSLLGKNKWWFRPRFSTVILFWTGDNLG